MPLGTDTKTDLPSANSSVSGRVHVLALGGRPPSQRAWPAKQLAAKPAKAPASKRFRHVMAKTRQD